MKKCILSVIFSIVIILSGCTMNNDATVSENSTKSEEVSSTIIVSSTITDTDSTSNNMDGNTGVENSNTISSSNSATTSSENNPEQVNSSNFNQDILFGLFKDSKDSVLKKLGDKYQLSGAGVEGSEEGYLYEELGITIVFDNDYVSAIYCGMKVVINGASAGMNFKQVQEKLGQAKIEETWVETPDNKAYSMTYIIENCIVEFLSYSKDGNESMLSIYSQN